MAEGEFLGFLDDVVSPLFPDGLTVVDASGRFRTAAGQAIVEPTKVAILVYPDDAEVRGKIRQIISAYRHRFDQESVGWVRSTVRACF